MLISNNFKPSANELAGHCSSAVQHFINLDRMLQLFIKQGYVPSL